MKDPESIQGLLLQNMDVHPACGPLARMEGENIHIFEMQRRGGRGGGGSCVGKNIELGNNFCTDFSKIIPKREYRGHQPPILIGVRELINSILDGHITHPC